jgi:hypothetical protein
VRLAAEVGPVWALALGVPVSGRLWRASASAQGRDAGSLRASEALRGPDARPGLSRGLRRALWRASVSVPVYLYVEQVLSLCLYQGLYLSRPVSV